MPLRNLLILISFSVCSLICYGKAPRNRYLPMIDRAMQLVRQEYLDDVTERELFENAMKGMVSGLDQYSSYFVPESFRQVEENLDQQFGGVGIKVELDQETKRLRVLSPMVGTPAYEKGIRAGDLILNIDGNSTTGMSLDEAVKLMRGKPGDPVQLTILHSDEDEPIELQVMRQKIHIQSVLGDSRNKDGSWVFRVEEDSRIAYIRLITFGEQSTKELEAALLTPEGETPYEALIIDLRDNGGGLLVRAVEICDLFIPSGRIVSTRIRGNVVINEFEAKRRTAIGPKIPMVVLTNRMSASASEILAACLQDHKRAVVVGERTWGKGTVQNIFKFESGKSALKLTTASYWRPNGTNIHRLKDSTESDDWGVRPSPGFEVKLTDEQFKEILEARRKRDIVHSYIDEDGQTRDSSDSNELPLAGSTEELARDIQLKKAVDYLRQQLQSNR
ncbi:MAG TPA: S41 family peptidase [Planctomycetaceae bacterium]|jgi:carboxyl-terminal processing protease|nr:S41 family peptidase [Planctomycetaceae bacterium]